MAVISARVLRRLADRIARCIWGIVRAHWAQRGLNASWPLLAHVNVQSIQSVSAVNAYAIRKRLVSTF